VELANYFLRFYFGATIELLLVYRNVSKGGGINKKVGSTAYLFSLKLTNLTKPKLMKKNVLQMYISEPLKCENNC